MKFYAETCGDPSVGIDGVGYTLEIHGWKPEHTTEDERNHIKKCFQEMLEGIDDTKVAFMHAEDECSTCGARGYKDGKCSRKECIENMPDETEFEKLYKQLDVEYEFRHSE